MRVMDSILDPGGTDVVAYIYLCPGCKMGHVLYIRKPRSRMAHDYQRKLWSFNGNMVHPTFFPRVLVTWPAIDCQGKPEERRCHHAVRNGMLVFEDDCTHALAGQTVKMTVRDD